MKRLCAVTTALLLLASLLGPMVLAERGGNGRGIGAGDSHGNGRNPHAQGPAAEAPADRHQQQDRSGEQAQQRDRDQVCNDCPAQDREAAKAERERAKEEAKAERERAKEPEKAERERARDAAGDGNAAPDDDTASRSGSGYGPQTPPGEAIAEAARNGLASGDAGTAPEVDENDALHWRLAKRLAQWQRKVLQSAKHALKSNNGVNPFMLAGKPEIDAEGNLAVTVWKGNRIVRDYQYTAATDTVPISPTNVIRVVGPSGAVTCEGTPQECLPDPLPEDASMTVWGRVETVGEGEDAAEVFAARRITVKLPSLPEPTATVPTPTATVPTPTATVPTPTATVPTPTTTIPAPTVTMPAPTATLPTPTPTAAG